MYILYIGLHVAPVESECTAGSPAQFPQDIDLVNVSQILQLSTDLVTQDVEVYLASFLWAESLDTQGVEHWVQNSPGQV